MKNNPFETNQEDFDHLFPGFDMEAFLHKDKNGKVTTRFRKRKENVTEMPNFHFGKEEG